MHVKVSPHGDDVVDERRRDCEYRHYERFGDEWL